LIRSNIWDSW